MYLQHFAVLDINNNMSSLMIHVSYEDSDHCKKNHRLCKTNLNFQGSPTGA